MELIGRDNELAMLRERLAQRRLVTVIGPGGVGKTALARAAVESERSRFELGARTVDLTRVESADAVGGALAGQLGFPSVEALLNSPSDQPVLLLVDNCEHVTKEAATVVAALLDSCNSPTVLATSRSPLDVDGESLVALGPLALPGSGELDVETAAVRLFLERARDAGVELVDDDAPFVVDLCRHLDGLPLALELAAARTRYMSPAEMLDRLGKGIDVLVRPRSHGRTRQRSLHDTIEWSYRLLDDETANLFGRLGVCPGPFTADVAAAVAGPMTSAASTTAAIERLVDTSLLVVERDGVAAHYRMLETIRTYALARLAERGELAEARDGFADHVCATATLVIAEAMRDWRVEAVRQVLDMYDNITSALRWTIAHDHEPSRAFLLVALLWGVVHQGHVDEIAELSAAARERWPGLDLPLAGDVAATLATALFLLGRPDESIELAESALAATGTTIVAPFTLRRAIALAKRASGDNAGAVALFREAASQARSLDQGPCALEADAFLAQTLADLGHFDEAVRLVGSTLADAAASGSTLNVIWARTVDGYIATRTDPAAAIAVIDCALAESRSAQYPFGVAANLRNLALAHLARGDARAAAIVLLELLEEQAITSAVWDPGGPLAPAALVLYRSGHPAWPDVAAAARGAPVSNPMAGSGTDLSELPGDPGRSLAWSEVLTVTRQALIAVVAATASGAASDSNFPSDVDEPREGAAVLRRDGDVWAATFEGETVHLKPARGMDDLVRLLAAPGVDVHCLELMGSPVVESGGEEVIDATARRQYEQRIRDLQGDIDEATAANDPARAEKATIEFDALVDHLTAALGLGGRTRRSGGSAEQARSAVTHRLRATIRRIADVHPALGRHLRSSITSGTYCAYRPDPPIEWQVWT